jgi:hypothetical protein
MYGDWTQVLAKCFGTDTILLNIFIIEIQSLSTVIFIKTKIFLPHSRIGGVMVSVLAS